MKDVIGFCSVFIILGFITVITKPTDAACIDEVTRHYTGDLVADLMDGRAHYVLDVEDHIFYKTVRNRITGHQEAVAAYCTVFF